MFPQEPRNPATASHEYCYIRSLKLKTKLLKLPLYKNMIEVLEETVNKSPNKIHENKNKQWKKMNTAAQDPKVERE